MHVTIKFSPKQQQTKTSCGPTTLPLINFFWKNIFERHVEMLEISVINDNSNFAPSLFLPFCEIVGDCYWLNCNYSSWLYSLYIWLFDNNQNNNNNKNAWKVRRFSLKMCDKNETHRANRNVPKAFILTGYKSVEVRCQLSTCQHGQGRSCCATFFHASLNAKHDRKLFRHYS